MSGWSAGWRLAEPGWLWALGALALPIAIHLISRGTARRVSMGSIGLLRARESRRARRFRPTELLLLLLRCLLLVVLALALAGWVFLRPTMGEPVWGLISDAVAAEQGAGQLDDATTARLDALRAAGQLRRLAPGLPVDLGDAAEVSHDTVSEDVWSYLREADAVAPPGTRFDVFAHDRLSHLRGARPTIAAPVVWAPRIPVASDPSVGSTPHMPPSSPSPSPSPRRVIVRHAHDRADDASYVVAALRAVDEASKLEIESSEINASESHASGVDATAGEAGSAIRLGDIVVWLGDDPLPGTWHEAVAAGATLLRDQGGRWSACATHVMGNADDAVEWHAGLPPRFQRARCLETAPAPWTVDDASVAPVSSIQTIWRDAHDRPVLTRQQVGKGAVWTLAGRFHPMWSTLVLSPSFPRWVATWLDQVRPDGAPDVRVPAPHPAGEQRLPRRAETARDGAASLKWPQQDDRGPSPLWWLVIVVVVVERAVSLRAGR